MVAQPWSSSRLSCGERILLRWDGNAGNSFPTKQGKDPSSGARRRKRGSSGCGRDSRASSRVENFKPRIDSHHGGTWDSPVGKPRGKDSWESLVGKPRGKATDTLIHGTGASHCCYSSGERARACPHSRRVLTPLGRLQKYPKIHVSTGEESSGSGTDSTQDLRPQHRRERNPERPLSNSHGD